MNTKNTELFIPRIILFIIYLPFLCLCLETDTMSSSLVIKDPDTIVSRKQVFKLGFFTPQNSINRYLAVFYNVSEEITVWIANRDKPLNDSSSYVTISKDGNLVLINGRNQTVWSTNLATTSPMNSTLQILDTGNLVLRDDATGTALWQSFSQPSDAFIPTMNITHNTKTGKKVVFSAWKNATDPEVGSFTAGIEASPIPQFIIWHNGRPYWRSGQWDELLFIGVKDMYSSYAFIYSLVDDHAGTFYFTARQGEYLTKIVLTSSGIIEQAVWDNQKKYWDRIWLTPENECDFYGKCGPFGSCNIKESPICSCLKGFEPTNKDEWDRGNWSSGCHRKAQLQCDVGSAGGNEDVFFRLQFMKVPDFAQQFRSGREDECRRRCLRNCSCIAYAHESKLGCLFWRDTLIDSQEFNTVGVDLYIRLSASELDNHKDKKLYIIIPSVVGSVSVAVLIFIAWCWLVKRKGNRTKDKKIFEAGKTVSTAIVHKDEPEMYSLENMPLFTFEMLANATDQFHEKNTLGRGGFGPVYKGNLENGKEIAVKRLSAASGQGSQEFMNEVAVISKLQHRNLVKLLGCCVEKEEKMLVYEYMPKRSLDVCLFDPTHPSQKVLDWNKRFSIIGGIGRGLLYLHKDSRLKIIHRDLKPSNVLLDEDLNPKISDFGLARIFGGNKDHDNTARVVGTYGYMAPEYAMEGRFSEKSDVYSFGVLMLEIIKGKKCTHYHNDECSLSLLGSAWKFWSEDNAFAFADESITSSNFKTEIVRCIQIALLCVQEFPKDRPTIQTVLSMLSCEIVDLPPPEQPIFAEKNGLTTGSTQCGDQVGYSVNELTLTVVDGR